MFKSLILLLGCCVFALGASADAVSVPYTTTNAPELFFEADTFTYTGQSGVLTLDNSAVVVGDFATAAFFMGDSGGFDGVDNLFLTYNFTLDGVTKTISQPVYWSITPGLDLFDVYSTNVLFQTAAGAWEVNFVGYAFTGRTADIGSTQSVPTAAIFTPVAPAAEPATWGLLLAGLGVVLLRRR